MHHVYQRWYTWCINRYFWGLLHWHRGDFMPLCPSIAMKFIWPLSHVSSGTKKTYFWDFDEVIKSYQASYTVNVSHWWNISRALCIFRLGARLDWGRLLWQSGADIWIHCMGLLPDTKNCRLRMRRECRKRFPHHWLQRKPLVSDPGMNHGTCVTHVPWCMSGSLTRGSG